MKSNTTTNSPVNIANQVTGAMGQHIASSTVNLSGSQTINAMKAAQLMADVLIAKNVEAAAAADNVELKTKKDVVSLMTNPGKYLDPNKDQSLIQQLQALDKTAIKDIESDMEHDLNLESFGHRIGSAIMKFLKELWAKLEPEVTNLLKAFTPILENLIDEIIGKKVSGAIGDTIISNLNQAVSATSDTIVDNLNALSIKSAVTTAKSDPVKIDTSIPVNVAAVTTPVKVDTSIPAVTLATVDTTNTTTTPTVSSLLGVSPTIPVSPQTDHADVTLAGTKAPEVTDH